MCGKYGRCYVHVHIYKDLRLKTEDLRSNELREYNVRVSKQICRTAVNQCHSNY